MSSPDAACGPRRPHSKRPTASLGLALAIAAALLAGCTDFRPLYGSLDGAGQSGGVGAKLRTIEVAVAGSRVDQQLRNQLVFGFGGGGGEPEKPVYRLSIRLIENAIPVGVERLEDIPAAYLLQLNANYAIVEIASGKTITTGTSFANASYDFSRQRFANVRAQRDAENRVAGTIAADIRTKVAAFFATRA